MAQTQQIILDEIATVMADATIAEADKLSTINAQVRAQLAALVDVENDAATFGTLTFDSLGGNSVRMQDATLDVHVHYNNGAADGDLIRVEGALDVAGNHNTINVSGLTFTGPVPSDDSSMNAGNLAPFVNVIETTDGILGNPLKLTIGGQPVAEADFADVYGNVVGNDYKLGLGLRWHSTRHDGAADAAHGNFTLADNSQFTVGGALANRTDTDGVHWDGQSLNKMGGGTLILNGANTYTGLSTVAAGMLVLGDASHPGAQIAGDVRANDSILAGFGTARARVDMLSGSTLAPGSAVDIATFTAGELQMHPGSTYAVKLHESGASDLVDVKVLDASAGTVQLDGADLQILNGGSPVPAAWDMDTVYTIVQTENGVTGTFAQIDNAFAFLQHDVIYNPDTVQLRMTRTPFGDTFILPPNLKEVGDGIDALAPDDPVVDVVAPLEPEQVAGAFDSLSGEMHASTRAALVRDRHLRDALNRRMRATLPEGRYLWVDVWQHDGHLRGKVDVTRVRVSGLGLALGSDHRFTPDLLAGAFVAYEDQRVRRNSPNSARGDVKAYSAGVYAAGKAGTVELRGALAYSRLDVDARRNIAVGALQGRVVADYRAHKVQAFVEAARPFAVAENTKISPYLNVAQTWLRTNPVRETGNAAALDVARQTDSVRTATLGVRAAVELSTRRPMRLNADLGWVRAFGDTDSVTSNRFAGRNARFAIRGVGVEKNTVLTGLGLDVQASRDTSLHLGWRGQFGARTRQHTGHIQIRVRF